MRSVDIEFAPPPTPSEKAAGKVRDSVAALLNVLALVVLVSAVPLNIWLWTVAL